MKNVFRLLLVITLLCPLTLGCSGKSGDDDATDDDNDTSFDDDSIDDDSSDDDTQIDDDSMDDDSADDDSSDDDSSIDDDTLDDDTLNDDTVDDDTTDDDSSDDDSGDDDTLADDWIADWPQSNIELRDYNESLDPGALRLKVEAYDAWHLANHQPYYGGTVDTKFTDDSRTVPQAYGGWGDSCIWTGTYLGSQAFRYYVTDDTVAKQNAINMVNTLDGFLHVTGKPGFIARYWGPQDSLIYQGDTWCDDPNNDRCHHIEDGDYAGDFWWGETSRDQYTGWFFGMAVAYDLVDDEDIRNIIRADITEVLNALIDQNWLIIDEAGQPTDAAPNILPPMRMSWLTIGYHITGESRFKTELQKWLLNSNRITLQLSSISFTNRYAQYYGNNLSHTNWFNLLRLGKVYFSEDDYNFLLNLFETQVHTFTRLSHNPWFNDVFMSQGNYNPNKNDDPYYEQLFQDLTDFRDAPNYSYYLAERTGYELDPISVFLHNLEVQFPWLENLIGGVDPQAIDAFPVPLQCSSGFLFQRNPFVFQECGVDDPTDVNPGVDYLIAYWLASYSKFIKKDL